MSAVATKQSVLLAVLLRCAFYVATLLAASCANVGSEKHFEPSKSLESEARAAKASPGLALVRLFRERSMLQPLVYKPIPPLYFAVDDKVVSVMPFGSFVNLHLEPGQHKLTQIRLNGGGISPLKIGRLDRTIVVVPGVEYYFGAQIGMIEEQFGLVNESEGRAIIKNSELAKLIHQPISVDTFVERIQVAERQPKPEKPTGISGSTKPGEELGGIGKYLPSAAQVKDYLEIVATVAIVGVLLFGAATVSDMPTTAPPSARSYGSLPPEASSAAFVHTIPPKQSWKTSSGSPSDIIYSKGEVTVYNTSTGINYRIENGKVIGSNGSRYRVVGNSLYSETGQSYQVVGNSVIFGDGTSCARTGVTVTCR